LFARGLRATCGVQSRFIRRIGNSARGAALLELTEMTRIATLFAAAALTAALAAPLLAQTTPPTTTPPPAAAPSTADKVTKRTKAEWKKLRAEWRKDKAKYKACSAKTKAEGLKGTKRLSAMYDCMTQ
jgi:hypothetical protein